MDKEIGRRKLQTFSHNAWDLSQQVEFEEAVQCVYGDHWQVTLDFQSRMEFSCSVCEKVMNSVKAVYEHNVSEKHRKKKHQCDHYLSKGSGKVPKCYDSLQTVLSKSNVRILGLNQVEERDFQKYRCKLCSAYGDSFAMYNHLIGFKHADAYINLKLDIWPTHETRENLCKMVFQMERSGHSDTNQPNGSSGKNSYPHGREKKMQSKDERQHKVQLKEDAREHKVQAKQNASEHKVQLKEEMREQKVQPKDHNRVTTSCSSSFTPRCSFRLFKTEHEEGARAVAEVRASKEKGEGKASYEELSAMIKALATREVGEENPIKSRSDWEAAYKVMCHVAVCLDVVGTQDGDEVVRKGIEDIRKLVIPVLKLKD